ncbi:unnamed protein product [Toxocara canis]|uniref:Uncharacterized protein n=1 Tax=Toxocara canis TaxID=6265 RepID=A0A183UKY1_TOXCA|nr:unnamed protein product [Toxocara canis]
MPRRRGEYSLNKATSYAVLPGLVASDICAAGVSSVGACRTTFRMNLTANDADVFELRNDTADLDADGNIEKCCETSCANGSAKENTHRGALFRELFYKKSKEKENGYRTPIKVRQQDRLANSCRTPSCDSPFRIPYRCPLDKMRIKTPLSVRRHPKQPPIRVLSFVSLLPEAQTVKYSRSTGSHALSNGCVNGSC